MNHSSNCKKIITVVGARPQFVKAAALSPKLLETGIISESIVHTGQHFDKEMSDVFFEEMGIPSPKINLAIGGGTHGQNTGRMIESLERVFIDEKPCAVMVYGDTDSTLAAAIAASKLGIILIHVEAGLRSNRRAMPEEINRVLTDHVSDVLYTPCNNASDNLLREGIEASTIHNSGDVMLDVILKFKSIADRQSLIIEKLGLEKRRYNLMTLHRKENVDDKIAMERILSGIENAGTETLFVLHPRTKKRMHEFGVKLPSCITILEPVGYLDMLRLIGSAFNILTDSGGLQKEAYFLNKPCITLRDETEWFELVTAGVNVLTGVNPELIAEALCKNDWPIVSQGIYGQGDAAGNIAKDLVNRLSVLES